MHLHAYDSQQFRMEQKKLNWIELIWMIFILWLKILNCTIFYIFLKLTGFYRAREWWWIIDETCTCDRIIFFQLAWASIDTFILQTLYFDCYLDFRFFVGFHFLIELFSFLSSLHGVYSTNQYIQTEPFVRTEQILFRKSGGTWRIFIIQFTYDIDVITSNRKFSAQN